MPCPMPSEDIVTPAFGVARRRPALGVRLEGRTRNIPSSGLSPNQFTAVSEAALYEAPERDPRRRASRGAPWASVGVPATLCGGRHGGEPSLPRAARARVRPVGPIGKSLYRKMGELGPRGAWCTDSRPALALAGCT